MSVTKNKYSELLNKNISFYIPYYQRYYDWDVFQCIEILTDIKELIEKKYKNKENHFMGMFVFREVKDDNDPYYELIDGQQRLTTIYLILKLINLYSVFLTKNNNSKLNKNNLFNLDNLNETRIKLRLNNEEKDKDAFESWINYETNFDNDIFKELLWDEFIKEFKKEKKIKSKKNQMFENSIEILEWLKENITNIKKLKLFNATLLSCEIIEFNISTSADNPQNIFESLNSKSKPLSDVDLIKNYIFMNIPFSHEQKSLYDEWWILMEKNITKKRMLDFFKFFIMIKEKRYIDEKNHGIFKCFKRSIIIDSKKKAEEVLEEIRKWYYIYLCSSNFYNLNKFKEIILDNEDYNYLLEYKKIIDSQFVSNKVGYTAMIIMALIDYIEENSDNKFNISDFKKAIRLIDKYVIRWKIYSNQGNLSEPFIKIYKAIQGSLKNNLSKNIKNSILSLNGQFKFATDIEFRTFLNNNSLNDNERYMINYLCENYYRKEYKIEIYKELFNEEHILPVTPNDASKLTRNHDRDINYIGNSMLISKKLNEELNNYEWANKWKIIQNELKNPKFVLTNSLKAFSKWVNEERIEKWTFDEIQNRTNYLVEEIIIPETTMRNKED